MGGLPYCKTYGGMCYVIIINNTFYNYGCGGPEHSMNSCISNSSINSDQREYLYSKQITCCNDTDWCNGIPATLEKVQNRLPDTERENGFDKQSCYCNVCGNNKTCLTNGHCYRDLTIYASPIYGCAYSSLSCGIIHHGHMETKFYDPPMQCCSKEKWCNFDIELIGESRMLDVDSEFKIRWIRFERLGYFKSLSTYHIIARNRIGGKIIAHFKKFDDMDEQSIETTNGSFNFEAKYNVLYEFQLKPYISNYFIESIRVFYYASIYKANVTWFQGTNIQYSTSDPTVVFCDRCINFNESYRCYICNSYNDPDLNPIILPEWS